MLNALKNGFYSHDHILVDISYRTFSQILMVKARKVKKLDSNLYLVQSSTDGLTPQINGSLVEHAASVQQAAVEPNRRFIRIQFKNK